ncbi:MULTISPECIES: hypothetical protein [unclassified Streptosporangium]|uniref:hypothetical protein n=1 Tax=unclassified Streptosporangium TaxID=2632669 RepID=UPI002E297851|nr:MULTISPECIES: hypothetical protein [unclassified Streptosporangium]
MINVEAGRLRGPAAWLMVAFASASVLVGIERLLFGGGSSSFAERAADSLGRLTSPVVLALLVGAVLLATNLGPAIERLKVMALVVAGTLGLSVLFGLIGVVAGLFGGVEGFMGKVEFLLVGLPALGLTTVALLYVLPKAIPAGSRAGAFRADGGFGRSPEHPQEQRYDAYGRPPVPPQGQAPFQGHPQGLQGPQGPHGQGVPQGAYPQAQSGVHPRGPQGGQGYPQDQGPQGGQGYPQDQGPQGGQGYPQDQGPQGGQGYPQDQGPQGGQGYPQDQGPQGGQGYQQEAPPVPAPQPPYNRPALPPAPAHSSAGASEGYGSQAASHPPPASPAPQTGDGYSQAPYAPPAENPSYAPQPGSYPQPSQQQESQGQGYAQPEPQNHPQPASPAGNHTPNPYVAADVQPPAPAKPYDPPAAAYDPPVYAAPVEPHAQTEPRLPSYPQFPDSSSYGQESQGFGQQTESSASPASPASPAPPVSPVYGQESQSSGSGRHSSPQLPSYSQYSDPSSYGQPESQGFGRQPDPSPSSAYGHHSDRPQSDYGQTASSGQSDPLFGQQVESPAPPVSPISPVYGQEPQPSGSRRQAEQPGYPQPEQSSYSQADPLGYQQADPQGYQRSEAQGFGRQPEPQGFGQQEPQSPGYGHQPEQQATSYPPADGRQGQPLDAQQRPPFDGQSPQSFPQPPENYGQPFGGYPGAEQSPAYPAPDPVDLRSQQMAQAYQQAESYQQQTQQSGTEPQLRVPEYGSPGYEGPFGHPQTPQNPPPAQNPQAPQASQAPQTPAYQSHQWDPQSEATLRFDPSAYQGDPLSAPAPASRTWDSQPIDPTAIYKPEQRPGQVTDEETPDRERVGPGQDQNMSWYGSDRREH